MKQNDCYSHVLNILGTNSSEAHLVFCGGFLSHYFLERDGLSRKDSPRNRGIWCWTRNLLLRCLNEEGGA